MFIRIIRINFNTSYNSNKTRVILFNNKERTFLFHNRLDRGSPPRRVFTGSDSAELEGQKME